MTFRRAVLLSVDTQSYGSLSDIQQDCLQNVLRETLSAAARASGIRDAAWHRQPAGDGEFSVIMEDGAEALILEKYLPEVHRQLLQRAASQPRDQLKLRLALHHGMVQAAPMGFSGAGPVEVARLLDSEALRRLVRQPGVLAAIAVSKGVYHDVVEGGHVGLGPPDFAKVEVLEKELRTFAYVHAPIMTGAQVGELLAQVQPPGRPRGGRQGKSQPPQNSLKNVRIERAFFGPFRDLQ